MNIYFRTFFKSETREVKISNCTGHSDSTTRSARSDGKHFVYEVKINPMVRDNNILNNKVRKKFYDMDILRTHEV